MDPKAKATVLIFVRDDCPISNRYAPEIGRLQAEFEPQGIAFRLIHPDPEATAEGVEQHLKAYYSSMQALRDPAHRLVAWAGTSITPEAAVVSGPATLVYRGRIDDQWVELGQARPEPSTHDLRTLLLRLVAGEELTFEATPAVGCYIADLK